MIYDIGILGAGNVGTALGLKWAQKGHKVTFGVRSPEKYKELQKKNSNITVKLATEIIKTHKLLVLAVPGRESLSLLESLGDLANKLIIDATNMFSMQKLIAQFPTTHFAKAFNHIGYNIMENPQFGKEKTTLLYCGNNDEIIKIIHDLATDLGFDPVLVGDNSLSVDLENFALLWIKMSKKIGRNFAFKLLK